MHLKNALELLGTYMQEADLPPLLVLLPGDPDMELVSPVVAPWTPNEKVCIMANRILRHLPDTNEYRALRVQIRYIREIADYAG
jgi:hypothetical protein